MIVEHLAKVMAKLRKYPRRNEDQSPDKESSKTGNQRSLKRISLGEIGRMQLRLFGIAIVSRGPEHIRCADNDAHNAIHTLDIVGPSVAQKLCAMHCQHQHREPSAYLVTTKRHDRSE
jgi:hypothetical protein